MTSISSTSGSTTSSYLSRYDTNGDGTVSASELAAANNSSSSTSSSTSETSTSESVSTTGDAAATQLSSLMMSMMLQAGGDEAQGEHSEGGAPAQMSVSDLDTNGDGVVGADEFTAGQPDDVSDDMSAQLFAALDADGDGNVTDSELSVGRNGPPPPPPSDAEEADSTDDASSTEDLLAQIQAASEQYASALADADDTTDTLLTV